MFFQRGFRKQHLSGASTPAPIPALAGVLAEAEVQAITGKVHSRKSLVPLEAPGIAMVMSGEES